MTRTDLHHRRQLCHQRMERSAQVAGILVRDTIAASAVYAVVALSFFLMLTSALRWTVGL